MKSIKFRNAILCEYVAKSAGNKHTLVGVYSGEIIISSMPGDLHLGFYCEILEKFHDAKEFTLEGFLGTAKFGQVVAEFQPSQSQELYVLAMPFMPVSVVEPGKLRLVLSLEGFRRTILLDKDVRLPQPTDSIVFPPPAGQSSRW